MRLGLHFYSGDDLAGVVIRSVTASRFSHVAIEAAGCVYEAVRSGFRKSDLNRVFDASASRYFDVAETDLAQVVGWCEYLLAQGGQYGWLSLLGIWLSALTGFPLYLGKRDEFICSTAVAECLLIAGIWTGETRTQTPGSLARMVGVA